MGDQAAGSPHKKPAPKPSPAAFARSSGCGHDFFVTDDLDNNKDAADLLNAVARYSSESASLIARCIASIQSEVNERVEALGGKLVADNDAVWRHFYNTAHQSLDQGGAQSFRASCPELPGLAVPGHAEVLARSRRLSHWLEPPEPLAPAPPRQRRPHEPQIYPVGPSAMKVAQPVPLEATISDFGSHGDALLSNRSKLVDTSSSSNDEWRTTGVSCCTIQARATRDEASICSSRSNSRHDDSGSCTPSSDCLEEENVPHDSQPARQRVGLKRVERMGNLAKYKRQFPSKKDRVSATEEQGHQGDRKLKRNVFPDADLLKEGLRQAIAKKDFDVTKHYRKSGICQFIARQPLFEHCSVVVTVLNFMWVAIEMDTNEAVVLSQAEAQFQITEHLFCFYFVLEWIIRVRACEDSRLAFRDTYLLFDTFLVAMMVLDTWIFQLVYATMQAFADADLADADFLKMFRIMRMMRMARMLRIFRAMPELVFLVKGLFVAARSVFFTLLLLFIIIYVFAIIFRQLCADYPIGGKYFSSVPTAFASLLLRGTVPDLADLMYEVSEANILLGVIFFVFILLATLTVMNMLVGVLVQVVTIVSAVEKEEFMVTHVKKELFQIIEAENLDTDGNGRLCQTEFKQFLLNNRFVQFVNSIGVDVVGLVDLAELIFKDETDVDFFCFAELLLQLRGNNMATVKDLVDMRKFMVQTFADMMEAQYDALCTSMRLPHRDAGARKRTTRKSDHPSPRWAVAETPEGEPALLGSRISRGSVQIMALPPARHCQIVVPSPEAAALSYGSRDYDTERSFPKQSSRRRSARGWGRADMSSADTSHRSSRAKRFSTRAQESFRGHDTRSNMFIPSIVLEEV